MKKMKATILILFVFLCSNLFSLGVVPSGTGLDTDPFLVSDLDNLLWVSTNSLNWSGANSNFLQTDDIDASATTTWNGGTGFMPIGNETLSFGGTYNGGGHTISNLYSVSPLPNAIGLFGSTNSATIEKLGLISCQIQGLQNVGGLVGYADGTTINECYVTGSAAGVNYVGLLVGYSHISTIQNCYALGVSGGSQYIGGLIGGIEQSVFMNNYAVVQVAGTSGIGGLAGMFTTSIAPNSFYDVTETSIPDNGFGTPLITTQMQNANTYILAGWDFVLEPFNGSNDYWSIHNIANGGYPFLTWQFAAMSQITDSLIIPADNNSVHPIGYTQVEIEIVGSHPEIILDVTLYTTAPNVVNGVLPPHVTSLIPVFWDVDSNGADGYEYNFSFDLTEFSALAEGSNFAILKRDNATQEWQDVLALNATVVIADDKATVSGLTSFSQFAAANIPEPIVIPADDPGVFGDPDLGVEIEFTTTPHPEFNLEIILVESTPTIVNGALPATAQSVCSNYWQVNCDGVGYVYSITFDLSDFPELASQSNFRIFKRDDNSAEWEDVVALGGTVGPLVGNKITVSGLDSFSEFVPAYTESTLPVELSSFTAIQTIDNYAQINWSTASESNLIGYNIFRNETIDSNSAIRVNSNIISASNSANGAEYSFIDDEISYNTTYHYWLESSELNNENNLYGPVTIRVDADNDSPELPIISELFLAYPNPFNPETTISFNVKGNETGSLVIYNLKGQVVKSYNKLLPGEHNIIWKGKNNLNQNVSSAIYFYQLKTDSYSKIRKMILMK